MTTIHYLAALCVMTGFALGLGAAFVYIHFYSRW